MTIDLNLFINVPRTLGNGENNQQLEVYIRSLLDEIELNAQEKSWSDCELKTIAFGGDSRWLIDPHYLKRILDSCERSFSGFKAHKSGVLLRIDPPHVSLELLEYLQYYPRSFLYLRSTTFDRETFADLNLPFDFESVEACINLMEEARWTRFGVGLVTGLKRQSKVSFRKDLVKMLSIQPYFICRRFFPGSNSLRGLSRVIARRLSFIGDRVERIKASRLRKLVHDALLCAGYTENREGLYVLSDAPVQLPEVSEHTIGIGCAAITLRTEIGGVVRRTRNPSDLEDYLRQVEVKPQPSSDLRYQPLMESYGNFIDNRLRSVLGLDPSEIESRFGFSLDRVHPGLVSVLEDHGYLIQQRGRILLTPLGYENADNVIANFALSLDDVRSVVKGSKSSGATSLKLKCTDRSLY